MDGIKDELSSLKADVARIEGSVARIERAIVGDPAIGHIGLADETRANRAHVHKLERSTEENLNKLDRKVIKLSAGVFGAGVFMEILKWLNSVK